MAEPLRKVFTRELFQAMQSDPDLSLAHGGEEEDTDFVPFGRPGRSYITVHPSEKYSIQWAVTYDFRRSQAKNDPYLVLESACRHFPPGLLRIKWIMLCLRFEDDLLKPFLWAADWHERSETPSDLHKSIERIVRRARQGWGQALFRSDAGIYTWRSWPDRQGEPPAILWPDRDFSISWNRHLKTVLSSTATTNWCERSGRSADGAPDQSRSVPACRYL
jgi:hypothetical protein